MPPTVNGMGTAVVPSGGVVAWTNIIWTRNPDFDALECMVFFWLPIFPYQTNHTFDWNGNQRRKISNRRSVKLIARCYLRRRLCLLLVIGVISLLVVLLSPASDRRVSDEKFSVLFLLLPLVGWLILQISDRRTKLI